MADPSSLPHIAAKLACGVGSGRLTTEAGMISRIAPARSAPTPSQPIARPNEPAAIQQRQANGVITARVVLLVLFARFALAAMADAIAVGIASVFGASDPVRVAGGWWMVWGTAVHLGCVA